MNIFKNLFKRRNVDNKKEIEKQEPIIKVEIKNKKRKVKKRISGAFGKVKLNFDYDTLKVIRKSERSDKNCNKCGVKNDRD